MAFGTYATAVHGLDNIEREQWRQIWPRIRDFRFEETPTVVGTGDSAWIAATWSSGATSPDGQPMSYSLDHKEGGRRLLEHQTLVEAGVQNGDHLIVYPEVVAG